MTAYINKVRSGHRKDMVPSESNQNEESEWGQNKKMPKDDAKEMLKTQTLHQVCSEEELTRGSGRCYHQQEQGLWKVFVVVETQTPQTVQLAEQTK